MQHKSATLQSVSPYFSVRVKLLTYTVLQLNSIFYIFQACSFAMKITHTTYIFVAGIAGENAIKFKMHLYCHKKNTNDFFRFRSVFCRVNQSVTWFEAQTFCRKKNLTLTSKRNASGNSYWTGFYKKTSHWIKIIGNNINHMHCADFAHFYSNHGYVNPYTCVYMYKDVHFSSIP